MLRPATAGSKRYEKLRDVEQASLMRSLRMEDHELTESFKEKHSSTPISYKRPILLNKSSYKTPQYKVEMYQTDKDLPPIKGSIYETAATAMQLSQWKSQALAESYMRDPVADSLNRSFNEDLRKSPEYNVLKDQEELMYVGNM